jgi:serine/threonine-protein phosphatase 2B catalytic subunit
MQMVNKASGIPRVITIFSAPNYCDVYKNKAACLKFDNNVLNIKQFIDSPHPYYLPNFMDVFSWSLPFVAEKVTDMLANVLDYEAGEEDEEEPKGVLQEKGGLLKKKVMAVSKLLRVYRLLREQNDQVLQLKQLTPNHKVPLGLIRQGPQAVQNAISGFEPAREADLANERRPGASNDKDRKASPRKPKSHSMDTSDEPAPTAGVKLAIDRVDVKDTGSNTSSSSSSNKTSSSSSDSQKNAATANSAAKKTTTTAPAKTANTSSSSVAPAKETDSKKTRPKGS